MATDQKTLFGKPPKKRNWSGGRDLGSPSYKASDAARVLEILRQHVGQENAILSSEVARLAGFKDTGRTMRSIMSAIDGRDVVLGYYKVRWVFVCATPEEAEPYTRSLERQSHLLMDRAERRREKIGRPGVMQRGLFSA